MGVVNTSYTFTATDTITSAKMNNIIDDTIMTGTAVSGSTLQVTPSGQLAVNSQGITSNELAAAAVTQTQIGANVAGTGPLCLASALVTTSVPTGVDTKIILGTESHDTNVNFANSRFTPTVAGYYQVGGQVNTGVNTVGLTAIIFKNGARWALGPNGNTGMTLNAVATMLYLNGSTDFVEMYAFHTHGSTLSSGGVLYGYLVRAA